MINNKDLKLAQNIMFEILKEVDKICSKHNINYWLDSGTLLGAKRHKGFIPWDDDLDIGMLRDDFERFKKIAKLELEKNIFIQTSKTDKEYSWEMVPMKLRSNKGIIIEKGEGNTKYNNGIFIDIFPFDYYSENKFIYKIQMIPKYLREIKTTKIYTEKKNLKNFIKYYIIFPIRGLLSKKLINFLEKILKNKKSKICGYGLDMIPRNSFKIKDIFPLKDIEFCGELFKIPNNEKKYLEELYGKNYMILPKREDRKTHAEKIEIFENDQYKENL